MNPSRKSFFIRGLPQILALPASAANETATPGASMHNATPTAAHVSLSAPDGAIENNLSITAAPALLCRCR